MRIRGSRGPRSPFRKKTDRPLGGGPPWRVVRAHHTSSPQKAASVEAYPMLRLLCLAVLSVGCLLYTPAQAGAQTPAEPRFSFDLRVPLSEALAAFSARTGAGLVYSRELTAGKTAACVIEQAAAEAVLRCILEGTGVAFERLGTGLTTDHGQLAAIDSRPAPRPSGSGGRTGWTAGRPPRRGPARAPTTGPPPRGRRGSRACSWS